MFKSACSERISAWHDSDNLWQARASLVSFFPIAGHNEYYPLIEISCYQIIKRNERFAKTAVGWILRELSKYDRGLVEGVIRQNIKYFSVESLKNATKYFEVQDKNIYQKLLREAQAE